MWWVVLFLAQNIQTQQSSKAEAARVRAMMRSSLEQQRVSIGRQLAVAVRSTKVSPHIPERAVLEPICETVSPSDLNNMIQEAADHEEIDATLVREVARQESGFRPCAISDKGAMGVMQLMPETQAQFAVSDPFDPQESINAGAKLLKQLLDRYHGDSSLALSAYNAGPSRVDQVGAIPSIPETIQYVTNILSRIKPVVDSTGAVDH